MISIQTPDGPKNLILRGMMTPTGAKGIAKLSILTSAGSKVIWDAGSYTALPITLSEPFAQGAVSRGVDMVVTTQSIVASVTGAIGTVTWLWEPVGAAGAWSILTPAASETKFRCGTVPPDGIEIEKDFKVTATDSLGRTGTATITAVVVNYGG